MKRALTVLILCVFILTSGAQAVSAAPRPTPTPTSTAIDCDEAVEYFLWFFPMLLDDPDATETIQAIAEEDIMTMTRSEFRQHGRAMLGVADTMSEYDPPPTMQKYHDAQTDFFLIVGEMFTLAAESGILTAALMYSDAIDDSKVDMEAAERSLNRYCPNAMDDARDEYTGESS